MEYNTQREDLRVPEYGRHIQLMIEYISTIEDRDERNKAANEVARIMAQQSPQIKNQPEYLQKIWDQIFIISDFKLDVDSPFPKPVREETERAMQNRKVHYHKRHHKYHFYGQNVELIIDKVVKMEDGELKSKIIRAIAQYMRISYKMWNDDKVADDVIIGHLKELSKGEIVLEEMPEPVKLQDKNYNRDYVLLNKGKKKQRPKYKKRRR